MSNFSETITYGLIVTLFGMGIVFIVLVLLQYILKSMEIIFHKNKKPAVTETRAAETKVSVAPEAPKTLLIETEADDDEDVVAVVTAAVISCLGGNHNIVVRNIRRVNDVTPAWGRASRTEQMGNRF